MAAGIKITQKFKTLESDFLAVIIFKIDDRLLRPWEFYSIYINPQVKIPTSVADSCESLVINGKYFHSLIDRLIFILEIIKWNTFLFYWIHLMKIALWFSIIIFLKLFSKYFNFVKEHTFLYFNKFTSGVFVIKCLNFNFIEDFVFNFDYLFFITNYFPFQYIYIFISSKSSVFIFDEIQFKCLGYKLLLLLLTSLTFSHSLINIYYE